MPTIYLLLTRSDSVLSRLVQALSGDPFTHASLSFSPTLQPLYSSGRKNGRTVFPAGPCREVFHRGFYHKRPHIPCALYALPVSGEALSHAQREIDAILSQNYRFNLLGMGLARLGRPVERKNCLFCSQFVGEVLLRSGAVPALPRPANLLRPVDLAQLPGARPLFQGTLRQLLESTPFPPA